MLAYMMFVNLSILVRETGLDVKGYIDSTE